MPDGSGDLLLVALTRLNVILASSTVLVAFSLLAYLFVYNFRNAVARAFVGCLAFLTIVYVGDVFLATARLPADHPAAAFWLRFEWLGIAFASAAFLHFSDALLTTTGDTSALRRRGILVAYGGGLAVLVAVMTTELVVGEAVGAAGAVRLAAGPLFAPFALAYGVTSAWGAHGLWRARRRALTDRSRRRMTYLFASVAVPLSAFPYLVAGGGALAASPLAFRAVSALANLAVATMTVVVAYAVAYHGALTPDRAIKRELMKYLIQGPTLGVFVIGLTQLVPERLEASLGLPRDVVLVLAVVFGIVAYQLVVRALGPLADLVVFGGEGKDVLWLRRLDERLLTPRDLEQLLENILTALCDRLRVGTGFIVVVNDGRLQLDVATGSRERAAALVAALGPEVVGRLGADRAVVAADGFWVRALRAPEGGPLLGLIAVEAPEAPLGVEQAAALESLVASAEEALHDRIVQARVVGALRALEPELAGLQRLRGALQGDAGRAGELPTSPVHDADFPHWVRDALAHYWGGPKLTDSPLLALDIAREALEAHDYNAAKAMRAVLDGALDSLRPEGERSLTASEWLVYNILELKFVRGLRVRDIAGRLAVSESDLYRKQRVAIEALARQLAAMEAQPKPPDGPAAATPTDGLGASAALTADRHL